MNSQQILAAAQSLLMILGSIGVAHSLIDSNQITTISSALPGIVGGIAAVFGAFWNHADASKGK